MRWPQLLIGAYVRRTYDRLTTRPGWPIGVFLLVSMLMDVVLLRPRVERELLDPAVAALYVSQVALAAIWLAMGRSPLPLRIVLAFLVWLAWVCVTSRIDRELWIMTGLMAGVVAVPLLALRPFGLRLLRVGENREWRDIASGPRRWQFSIGQMLGLTTAVAIVLGMMQFMRVPFFARTVTGCLVIVAFATGQGLLAWAALWAGLGSRRGVLRTVVVVVAAATAFLALATALGGARGNKDFLANIFALETVLLVASLWVFRLAGYRVVFRRGGTIAEPQVSTKGNPERRE